MVAFRYLIKPGLYRDSVALMRLSTRMLAQPGVQEAVAMMATPANRETMSESGQTLPADIIIKADDLLLAVQGQTEEEAQAALAWADAELSQAATISPASSAPDLQPGTLAEGLQRLSTANIALIAVPGDYAYGEALKALKAGRHVVLFSSGVTLADELRLKRLAASRGLLLMGAECGTGFINGVPLGFANVVRRGNIGLVAASGTGLQEVMCLIDRWGGGISHAIGTGGRDLDEQIGGLTTLAGMHLLEADSATEAIVLISKPPAPAVADRVLREAAYLTKPCIVAFVGITPRNSESTGAKIATTLEDAARLALAAIGITAPEITLPTPTRPRPPRRFVRGLFAGGTLRSEAAQLLGQAFGPVLMTESSEAWPEAHVCLDLGDEVYTRGRPHPMIDPRLRVEKLRQAAQDSATGVVLFDVILGYGANPDPVGPLLEAIQPTSDGPLYIAHVCGTEGDPQSLGEQENRLRQAGVWLAPTNVAAARLAVQALSV